MTSLRLHIIRHAPVVGKKGFIYGDDADIDLESQSETLQTLAQTLPGPDKADWYHSGVDRAQRTAKAVLSLMRQAEASVPGHTGFREQDFGDLLGRKHEDIVEHLKFIDGKIYAPSPPSGESIETFIKRVSDGIASVRAAAHANNRHHVVIFAHGGTIRAVHAAVNKMGVQDFITLDTPPLFAYECEI
jgi:broad specificity phosphatase PhoE